MILRNKPSKALIACICSLSTVAIIGDSSTQRALAAGNSYSGGTVAGPGGASLPITRVITVTSRGGEFTVPTEYGKLIFQVPTGTFQQPAQLVLANAISFYSVGLPGKQISASFFIAMYRNGSKINGDFSHPITVTMAMPFANGGDEVYIRSNGEWIKIQNAVVGQGLVTFQISSDPVVAVVGRKGATQPIVIPGARGQSVKKLQQALNLNRSHLTVDGIYGPMTYGAVAKFQSDVKLKANGIVGPRTWALLLHQSPSSYPKLSVGADFAAVTILRGLLIQQGYSLPSRGSFNEDVKNAVTDFQRRHRIHANGVVKRGTWLKLGVQ